MPTSNGDPGSSGVRHRVDRVPQGPTLVDVLRWRAVHEPDLPAYLFLKNGVAIDDRLTYRELDRRAGILSGWLRQHSRPGDRALLVYPSGVDVCVAFWACLYAGVTAVPAPPPDPVSPKRTIPRLKSILHDSGARLVLSVEPALSHVGALSAELGLAPDACVVDTSAVSAPLAGDAPVFQPTADHLAFLQYTSGSTSEPKGVMVTHGNLAHHCRVLHAAAASAADSRCLTWLPYFHDYGLIHGIVAPLFAGQPSYVMPPLLFLKEPVRWLEAITAHGITHSGAPNFAYEHCVRNIDPEQRGALNLSSWQVASCGAEPIRESTMQAFDTAYAPYGFRAEAFCPAYGMAESTLLISLKTPRERTAMARLDAKALEAGRVIETEHSEKTGRTVVGCGAPIGDTTVRIVVPGTSASSPPDHVGEIWIAGPSVARGYWNRPDETAHTFAASLSDTGEGPFLRTGDLGFLKDGQLFITGRLKDLIIVRGRNHYPQDIEFTVERSHPALRLGGGAAFSVERSGEEEVVVVQEVDRHAKRDHAEAICAVIRQHVAEQHELHLSDIVLIRAGTLPKTSSGKVQRNACRQAYLAEALSVLHASRISGPCAGESTGATIPPEPDASPQDRAAVESYVRHVVAEQLKLPPGHIRPGAPLASFGLDSLMTSIIKNRLEQRFGISPSFAQLMDQWTIRDVADYVARGAADRAPTGISGADEADGEAAGKPLSFHQRRILFVEQMYPGTSVNTLAWGVRLRGALDVPRLDRCLSDMAARHDLLRARFVPQGEGAVAVMAAAPRVPFETCAVTSLEAALSTIAPAFAARPFDPAGGPLIRVLLASESAQDHVLLVAAHRLIADGWSLRVFCRELTRFYGASGEAVSAGPASRPCQYADYVAWQRALLESDARRVQEAYWKRQLGGLPPPIELPADFPRAPRGVRRGRMETRVIAPALFARMSRFCRDHGVTPFMLWHAALAAWLWRCTGESDVVVGSVAANRRRAEFEGLFGYCVNTVALRTALDGTTTGDELLQRVRRVVTEAYDHQDLPFEAVLDAVKLRREDAGALFNVMLVLEEDPVSDLRLPGVEAASLPVEPTALECDAVVMVMRRPEGMELGVAYDADLFKAGTAARMLAHVEAMLAGIVAKSDAALSAVSLLTEEERHTILVEWNRTHSPMPDPRCVHQDIAAQARRTPDAAAVISGHDRLTYAELDRQSDRLASVLGGMQIGRGHRVAILCERSAAGILAVLGVLKAGAAYVPLDPAWPDQRVRSICEDADVSAVVTHRGLSERVQSFGGKVLNLDALDLSRAAPVSPVEAGSLDDAAYVMYTSGSTGQPKGVQISHRSLSRSLHARLQYYTEKAACFLLTFPLAFDGSVTGIYWTLLQGGTLVVPVEEEYRDPIQLGALIGRHRVTHLVAVPSLYDAVLRHASFSILASLRVAISAGEALPMPLVRRHYDVAPRAALYNEYGPTEATVWCTVYKTSPDESGARVPIGRPIANMQAYVLDSRRQPVPVGMPGELYIAGACLAEGYVGDPTLTARKFVAHPFQAGALAYRTGDLARYRDDGNLEFMGRIDGQIKLRGYRIEPEEIEAVLCSHAEVRRAAVVLREDKPGQQRLVAYVVPAAPRAADNLSAFLAARLPSYMVPALLVEVESLPITAGGKVDRRALPAPDPSQDAAIEPPCNATEAALATIWSEVLQIPDPGRQQDFFQLGGHSLLATQIASRIRDAFGMDCPLRTLFERRTIAELAAYIDEHRKDIGKDTAPPDGVSLAPAPRSGPLPLSFSQQRMWFMQQLSPDGTAYNMPIATRLSGPLNRRAFEAALRDLVQRHESFRTTFALGQEGPVQLVHETQPVTWSEVDLRHMPAGDRMAEADRLIREETGRPFDLASGPPARCSVIRIEEHEHLVLLNMHHIVGDQWSFGIIGREFARLYNRHSRGEPAPSKPPALQYADVAVWQRRVMTDEALAGQWMYWKERLAGLPVLALPTDFPRPQVQRFVGSHRSVQLSDDVLKRLSAICAERGATLFMGLLAAFHMLLSRYSGQHDVAVGVPIANRTHRRTEDIIGTFVNTLVMRTDLSGNPIFLDYLDRVREAALGAYAHQDYPFERLVESLSPDRDLSHSPLVQVLFNVANAPIGRIELDGLTWTPYEFDGGAVQFDLTMTIDTAVTRKVFLGFRTDLYAGDTIERMINGYRTLLEDIAADPGRALADYAYMSLDDRQRLLVGWNRTDEPIPAQTLPELIAAQAARTPGAVAVSMGGASLTYKALEEQATTLAQALHRRGVRRGALVGICLDRRPHLLVGLLGILKAGAAYVPLDPDYPAERLRYTLDDSGARLLVTSSAVLPLVPRTGQDVLCLDRDTDVAPALLPVDAGPRPTDAAYVLYTSGSTGKPKGVAISHRSLVNFLWSMKNCPGIAPGDCMLSVTTLSFDIAGLELYLPLIAGGSVELVGRQTAADGHALKAQLERSAPDIMQATPATWRMLIDAGWSGAPHLVALCGGEALPRDLADRMLERVGALWNMYGPTETTIWSTLSRVTRDEAEITIGRPIANTQLYVLDEARRPVPIGVPGELYIGGAGLALGYHHRPELTAERFIPNPFDPLRSPRLYRTGDLVRYRSDGQLVHLGRLDHQVKIRGFRVELGEIEAALAEQPGVRQAVVTARSDASGAKQLVAYVGAAEERLAVADLKAALRRSLPEYMVPAHVVSVREFPLTANGKIDIMALPAPEEGAPRPTVASARPQTAVEIQLTALWQQVLGLPEIGVHDNFFDLGGHSLKAVQLFAHLERVFGKQLPLATLFQAPTIAQLADVLTAANWTAPWRSLVAIQPGGSALPCFAVPGVGGNVLGFAKLAQRLGPNQPFYGLQTRGLDGREAPFRSLKAMAAHYVNEIRTVQPTGPYVLMGTCTGGVVAYEMAQQLMARHERVTLMILESWHPLSYNRYLLRVKRLARPMLYGWTRVAQFLEHSRHLSFAAQLRLGMRKLGERVERAGLDGGGMVFGETFNNLRVAEATLEAVAFYKAEEYRGRLLNVTASERVVPDSVLDTRKLWEFLARGGATAATVPAHNSGQLFVSPHVEVVAELMREYIRHEAAKEHSTAGARSLVFGAPRTAR